MMKFLPEKESRNWLFFFVTTSIIFILIILIRLYISNGYSFNLTSNSIPYILFYGITPALVGCAAGYLGFIAVSTLTLAGSSAGLIVFLYSAIKPLKYQTFGDLAGVAWFISLVVLGFAIGVFIEIILFIYRRLKS